MHMNGRSKSQHRRMAISLMTILSIISILTSIPSTSGATFTVPQFNAPPIGASRGGFLKDVLQSNHNSKSSILSNPNSKADNEICKPTGQIQDACCDYETVEDINQSFFDELASLVKTKYFRYYKVDLYKDCPFWVDNSLCMNRDCTVKKAQEEEIPEAYRKLSSVSTTSSDEAEDHTSECTCRETDFCHWDDTASEAVYVDLLENPERFTGYAGSSANRVWKSIYEENCFGAKGSYIEPPRSINSGGGSGFVDMRALSGKGGAGGGMDTSSSSSSSSSNLGFSPILDSSLGGLMNSLEAPIDPASSETCLEKRVFYRLISGLHASISIHICDDYLDPETGKWGPNLDCFISRIAQHPERLQNVYFNYVLILRALARAAEYKIPFALEKGQEISQNDLETKKSLENLAKRARDCPPTFDEHTLFTGPDAENLKHEFKDHFRNVSAIMDCVGCDKCRLWGKLQVNGVATALKILFSFDDQGFDPDHNPAVLQRSELVALINTAHRFAESLRAVETFRGLYQETLKQEDRSKKESEPPTKSSSEAPPISTSSSFEASQPTSHSTSTTQNQTSSPSFSPEAILGTFKSALDSCKSSLEACLRWIFSKRIFNSQEL